VNVRKWTYILMLLLHCVGCRYSRRQPLEQMFVVARISRMSREAEQERVLTMPVEEGGPEKGRLSPRSWLAGVAHVAANLSARVARVAS
jgi:hypothetical protein